MKQYTIYLHYTEGAAFQYFDKALRGAIKRLRQRIRLQADLETCLLSAAVERRTACISWGIVARPRIAKNLTSLCGFSFCLVRSQPIVAAPTGFAFPKNLIYTEAFAVVLGWMVGSGLVEKWNSDVSHKYSKIGREWTKSRTNGSQQNELLKSIELTTA